MSADADFDLSGRWSGIYNYPRDFPPNMFEAVIRDSGGIITGEISQPGEFFEPEGLVRTAMIDGRREGASVTFVKYYDDPDRPTPHYHGTVQSGGDEISGEWSIPGDWSGTFIMVRAARGSETAERKIEEEVR